MKVLVRLPAVCLSAAITAAATLMVPAQAKTPDVEDLSGTVLARVDGRDIRLPLLKADYEVAIEGDVAHVSVTQTFFNPAPDPLHATYLFPLNQKAAVHAMRMDLAGETIVARIREKSEAKAVFEKAKSEGKAASLLTQHRPNMFTQDIANLLPGQKVKITLDYVQNVPKIDGAYELVVPMVVGPRYDGPQKQDGGVVVAQARGEDPETGATARIAPDADAVSGSLVDRLPDYPKVIGQDAPAGIDENRVSLALSLQSPIPVSAVWSDTHSLAIDGNERKKSIRFREGREVDNRDFVLRYELASEKHVAAGVTSFFDVENGGYLSLMIEPPKLPAEDMIGQREMVFVLDTSGSMSGLPMAASKTFMKAAIKALRPDDYVRILRFSDNSSQFASRPVLATEKNKRAALDFVAGLSAGGGTEMNDAINAAFDMPQPDNTTRIVVFLTDGYIGFERTVIQTVSQRIGNARIYAFGVGDAVNRFLLDAIAKEGRGYARYVPVGGDAHEVAESLAAKLKSPLLTDISIDWNGLAVTDPAPARIPDLFEGGAVRVLGRYRTGGKHRIHVVGKVNGRTARMPLDIDLAAEKQDLAEAPNALPLIWAREQIFDKNRAYTIGGSEDETLRREITQLGLAYSLQSRFTSFVAVSESRVNDDPASTRHRNIPLPQVSNVSGNAYPSLNLSGSSAPEPEGIFGLLMVLMALAARFRRAIAGYVRLVRTRIAGFFAVSTASRTVETDRSLPKALRKDGWWLET
ncbi:VIT and vWA domain-containing protein [Roseibium sp.]|uniref:VIT and vWA domain-containing protein n=1 Tax=Roseibium sp. TaxID=1936156 RepID=UPI003D0F9323